MTIAQRLIEHLKKAARAERVGDVRIGLAYTAVRIESGGTGLAYTFRPGPKGGCSLFGEAKPLAGRLASDLIEWLRSPDPLRAGVALAAANAFTNSGVPTSEGGDVLEFLDVRPDDEIGMVGNFGPLRPQLTKMARRLHVFDRSEAGGEILPEEAVPRLVPLCQIVLITSTALLNGTLDDLLRMSAACRQVFLLGPSTPLVPEIFRGTPVTHLSGVEVTRGDEILRAVSEGGGMPTFRGCLRKVTLRVGAAPDSAPFSGASS